MKNSCKCGWVHVSKRMLGAPPMQNAEFPEKNSEQSGHFERTPRMVGEFFGSIFTNVTDQLEATQCCVSHFLSVACAVIQTKSSCFSHPLRLLILFSICQFFRISSTLLVALGFFCADSHRYPPHIQNTFPNISVHDTRQKRTLLHQLHERYLRSMFVRHDAVSRHFE